MPVSMSMQKSNFGSIYIYIVPLVLETSFFFVQNFVLFFSP
jgi:hypothetical protein